MPFIELITHITHWLSTLIKNKWLFADQLHGSLLLYIANTPMFTFAPHWQWSLWVTLTHNTGNQSDLIEGAVLSQKKRKKRKQYPDKDWREQGEKINTISTDLKYVWHFLEAGTVTDPRAGLWAHEGLCFAKKGWEQFPLLTWILQATAALPHTDTCYKQKVSLKLCIPLNTSTLYSGKT